jgi:hypothetical protein
VQSREAEKRKLVNPETTKGDALVDAVTAKDSNDRDANDNIIDRITGKEVRKPGDEEKHGDITVPSPSKSKAATPAQTSSPSAAPAPAQDQKKDKGKGKKGGGPMDGLEL